MFRNCIIDCMYYELVEIYCTGFSFDGYWGFVVLFMRNYLLQWKMLFESLLSTIKNVSILVVKCI